MTGLLQTKHREDIQALRGFAVLVVVLYHAKLSWISAGYLGVDVFFVISGFLITKLVKEKIELGNFSFTEFYMRRAMRLLPAAYVTFAATAVLAGILLSSTALESFKMQMVGALTFTANMVLWRQSGYFASAAELKPLLHIWSLSIEEQYYFVLPALLYFSLKKYWLRGACVLLLGSYALCILASAHGSAAFYLLPTRAWELLIGSVAALLVLNSNWRKGLKIAFWPMLVVLWVLPWLKLEQVHPGPAALAVCLATAAVILRQHPMLTKGFVVKIFAKLGDVSYSWYLVHWPLFAFLNNVWLSEAGDKAPLSVRLSILGLSLLLAYVLNKYVELPFRTYKNLNLWSMLKKLLACTAVLVSMPMALSHAMKPEKDYQYLNRENAGFDLACTHARSNFIPTAQCSNSENPEMMVWGDSFAMQMIPGLLSFEPKPKIIQATLSSCGPLLGISPVKIELDLTDQWAKNCIQFNESVLSHLAKTPSIKFVVLSSPFGQYLDVDHIKILQKDDNGRYAQHTASAALALTAFRKTIDEILKLGKTPVLIAPPPGSKFDIAHCLERAQTSKPIWGVSSDCKVTVAAYHAARRDVRDFVSQIKAQLPVAVISLEPALCNEQTCQTSDGSKFVARKMDLLGQVQSAQRMGGP